MDNFEQSLNEVLVDTFNMILKFEEQSLRKISDTGVTVSEAHMLEAIGKLEGEDATVSQIATVLGVALPTVTVALKKLESKGLITKVQSEEDARRVEVRLSREGQSIDKAHHYFHHRMVHHISREFGEEEKVILLSAVRKLDNFFRERTDHRE